MCFVGDGGGCGCRGGGAGCRRARGWTPTNDSRDAAEIFAAGSRSRRVSCTARRRRQSAKIPTIILAGFPFLLPKMKKIKNLIFFLIFCRKSEKNYFLKEIS